MSNEQSVPLVLALDDPAATLEQVGGKGASLARLAAVGLPIPPGFHITTAAYRYFVTENGLQEQILATVSAVTADQPTSLEEASRKIGRMFAQGSMPAEIAAAISAGMLPCANIRPIFLDASSSEVGWSAVTAETVASI